MIERIEEEHVVHVRFNDPRDRMHGIKKNYSVKLRVSKAVSKAHAESKVALHMRKSGYVITSMKTTRRKKLREDINEVAGLSPYFEHTKSGRTLALRRDDGKALAHHHKGDSVGHKLVFMDNNEVHSTYHGTSPGIWTKLKKNPEIKKLHVHDPKAAAARFKDRSKMMREDIEEAVAGMDHANKIYADNTSGGSTIWSDGSNKAHRPFSGNKTGKPANANRRIYLVRKIKETLEMDDPATADRARKTKVLSKIVDLKGPTDYMGNTPDERAIRKWYSDNTLKHPDRNGNGDDVFSATGLKRASGKFNPDDNVQRYTNANEEVEQVDEISRGRLRSYNDAAVKDLGATLLAKSYNTNKKVGKKLDNIVKKRTNGLNRSQGKMNNSAKVQATE